MRVAPFLKTYGNKTVLDFPGMDLETGAIYCLVGANGSGKTTFGKILSGVLKANERGSVHSIPSVGYLPQKPFAFHMSLRSNLLLSCNDPARAQNLMEALQIDHLAKKPAHKLSGGETARMALARLLMNQYDLIILDEPTAAMDMESTILAESCIASYVRRTGCTTILITHSLQQAQRLADQILFFYKGKLHEQGPKDQVLCKAQCQETQKFLDFYGFT